MKKSLLLFLSVFFITIGYSQTNKFWTGVTTIGGIRVSKTVQRSNFPDEFKLFQLDLNSLRQSLSVAPDRINATARGVIIPIPNAAGESELFEVFEASNFEPALQAQFPEIRAYVGVGIDDVNAKLRMSVAPTGIQTMVFRTDKSNEFMESYSNDGSIYAVYSSSRTKGGMPFTCGTQDVQLFNDGLNKTGTVALSNAAKLKTFRLALSCTAEYANYYGATSTANVGLVMAAFNATMTRVNGVFEKDFAIHMNMIANEAAIIFYDFNTDPYDASYDFNTMNWNYQLQPILTSNIGEANYDIGHLVGATGGGGNAGCIGCVCNTATLGKGSGITSPADGNPIGDNFDIDFVAHEMGHQFGCNHTFSYSTENTAVNIEPGSGSTIMGYAGVTGSPTDIQLHSDAYFAYRSILQVQTNMLSKTCSTDVTLTNPVFALSAGGSYTIPKGTAFKLTGARTDSNTNVLSYCWEENDDATTVGATVSMPDPTKTNGANFRSLTPVSVPYRYMPALSTVISNSLTTTWETVSTVGRTLNFTLTGRDNLAGGGQTQTASAIVTVSSSVGPFTVTSQSTAEAWNTGESKTITWNRNSAETLAGSANVDILLSTDGGLTFPITLASGVTNSGTATIVVPSVTPSLTCRLMVKPSANIYYAVNSAPFYIGYTISSACNTYNYTTAFALPDNGSTYTIKSLTVPATTGTISDVNINVNATHPNLQNLVIAVVRPGGSAPLNLFNQSCTGSANMNVTFDSQGATLACASPTTGTYQPASTLNAYNGFSPSGLWQMGFWDKVAGSAGTINSFSIEVCTQSVTLTTDAFAFENFSLYPNPNKGSFNVKFGSNSSNTIQVSVYDMRGRAIFNKAYQNTGLFDQNVQLETVQTGIYLVNVQDGDKKIVKKIVIE